MTSKDFRVFLVPGNKKQTMNSVKKDMARIVASTTGNSGIVFNTERETDNQLAAVERGLGKGWRRVLHNENTIAYGSNWVQASKPTAQLLAKQDPSMAKVSPWRYLSTAPLKNKKFEDVRFEMKGTHLLSEANCSHKRVRARKWREKMWPIQVEDVLDNAQRSHEKDIPIVLAGDFNTGVFFNGHQLFALLRDRFGKHAVHVHNGHLDHIFLISTDQVKLTEVGKDIKTNNASDHDMVSAMIRATLV